MELAGTPTAIVTGGGGENIGGAVSRFLADAGAQVLILDIDSDAAESVVEDVETADGTASFVECDVTDVEAVERVVGAIADEFDGLDILVNNVGGASGVRLDEIDEEAFEYNIDTNLRSALFTTKAALPHLERGDGGSVTFVSSVNALLGGFSQVAYSVSKAGLHALARCLTADHADEGVRFNVVAPGSVVGDSETWERRETEHPGTLDSVADLYPCGRYGRPEDIASAVLFLSSERASWISGVVLPVDGGVTATGALPGGRWWRSL